MQNNSSKKTSYKELKRRCLILKVNEYNLAAEVGIDPYHIQRYEGWLEKNDELTNQCLDKSLSIMKYSIIRSKFEFPYVYKIREKLNSFKMVFQDCSEYNSCIKRSVVHSEGILSYAEAKGEAVGLEKGRAEGIEKGVEQTALNMLRKNCDTKFISNVTGLIEAKILKLKSKLSKKKNLSY